MRGGGRESGQPHAAGVRRSVGRWPFAPRAARASGRRRRASPSRTRFDARSLLAWRAADARASAPHRRAADPRSRAGNRGRSRACRAGAAHRAPAAPASGDVPATADALRPGTRARTRWTRRARPPAPPGLSLAGSPGRSASPRPSGTCAVSRGSRGPEHRVSRSTMRSTPRPRRSATTASSAGRLPWTSLMMAMRMVVVRMRTRAWRARPRTRALSGRTGPRLGDHRGSKRLVASRAHRSRRRSCARHRRRVRPRSARRCRPSTGH